MVITTTNMVEGRQIDEYKGIVFGEVVSGVDFIKDFTAGIRDIFGGRSKNYEDELQKARQEAISEMKDRAIALGADAIIGIDVDYEVLGANGSMMMVTTSGTAVTLK